MEITHIPLEGRMIPLGIRRHRRSRRISLRLSPARDAVVLTLPLRAAVEAGMKFFHSKSQWVLANVEADTHVKLEDGAVIPVLGQELTIHHIPGRGNTQLSTHNAQLLVYGDPAFTPRRVRDFLKKHLRDCCLTRAQKMATSLGKQVREVKIRDTRSRWGSCSRDGTLTFHWQLVFAPPAVLDYLIAHETAHLAHMNHSPRFWKTVETLCPDYLSLRRWLKREGHKLHRYGTPSAPPK